MHFIVMVFDSVFVPNVDTKIIEKHVLDDFCRWCVSNVFYRIKSVNHVQLHTLLLVEVKQGAENHCSLIRNAKVQYGRILVS